MTIPQSAATKLHLSLDVNNVDESVRFYSILFGTEPTKVKPGYAKFDLAEPAVNLTLNENAPCCITGLSHMGVRVSSTEEVTAAKQRLEAAGLIALEENNTTCCYAMQDKVWVIDPTGYRWEVYVFKGDAQPEVEASSTCCSPADAMRGATKQSCCGS
jgi:extradiol dioxygenase family protein